MVLVFRNKKTIPVEAVVILRNVFEKMTKPTKIKYRGRECDRGQTVLG